MLDMKVDGTTLRLVQHRFEGDVITIQHNQGLSPAKVLITKSQIDCLIRGLMKAKRELGMAPSSNFEQQRQTICYKRVSGPRDTKLKFRAWVKEVPGRYGEGETREAAVGALLINYAHTFNVEVQYDWMGEAKLQPQPQPQEQQEGTLEKLPVVPVIPQVGMTVQYHAPLYTGTQRTSAICAMIVGRSAVDPHILSLKLFYADGREEVKHNVKRGAVGVPGTWNFCPVFHDIKQAAADALKPQPGPVFNPQPTAADALAALDNLFARQRANNQPNNYNSAPLPNNRVMTDRELLYKTMEDSGQKALADRLRQTDACDNPKLLAFPTDDVTMEVDQDGTCYISDHDQVTGIKLEDLPAVITALQELHKNAQGGRG